MCARRPGQLDDLGTPLTCCPPGALAAKGRDSNLVEGDSHMYRLLVDARTNPNMSIDSKESTSARFAEVVPVFHVRALYFCLRSMRECIIPTSTSTSTLSPRQDIKKISEEGGNYAPWPCHVPEGMNDYNHRF